MQQTSVENFTMFYIFASADNWRLVTAASQVNCDGFRCANKYDIITLGFKREGEDRLCFKCRFERNSMS